MTTKFIIFIFSTIVIYDIIVAVTKRQTITEVFRKWYNSKPIIPYMVGAVFIGHFQTLVPVKGVLFFIIASALFLTWCILMTLTKINFGRGFYKLSQKIFLIPMIIGTIIGSFWRS